MRHKGLDVVLVYTRSTSWLLTARLLCSVTGAVYLHEDCELPFAWRAQDRALGLQRWFYERVVVKLFDGCIAISTDMEEYCRARLRRGARVLVVPILVDVEGFDADIAIRTDAAGAGD